MFDPKFVLLPTKKDPFLQKEGYKRHTSMVSDSDYFEMILILLANIVIFYV